MDEKNKVKHNAIIAGRKIEMTSPYDLQACIEKLASLQKNDGWFAHETIKVNTSKSSGNVMTYSIERGAGRGKSRTILTINGALRANHDGTTEVFGEVPAQDVNIAVGLLFVVGMFVLWFFIMPADDGMRSVVMVVGMIFVSLFLFTTYRRYKSSTHQLLELVRKTLE